MAHQEFGVRLLERIRGDLDPYALVEQFPRMEGRQMVMLLAPKKTLAKPHHPDKPEDGAPQGAKASAPEQPRESTAVGSK
jgi:translation initiation factor IF-3